jgi:hypothetical protein
MVRCSDNLSPPQTARIELGFWHRSQLYLRHTRWIDAPNSGPTLHRRSTAHPSNPPTSQPARAEFIKRGRSTPLDPSLPIDARDITSRIIIDATIPFEWKEKPIPVELDPEVKKRVEERWKELFG